MMTKYSFVLTMPISQLEKKNYTSQWFFVKILDYTYWSFATSMESSAYEYVRAAEVQC